MLSRLIGLKSVSCCCELAVQLCSASQLDSTLSGHHTFVALPGEWGTLCQCPSFCPLFVSHVWWEANSMAVFLCPFYLTKHSGSHQNVPGSLGVRMKWKELTQSILDAFSPSCLALRISSFMLQCAVGDRNEASTMTSGVSATRLKKLHFMNWLN